MNNVFWIFASGVLMSAIALVGSVTLFLRRETLERVVTPLVAFAAGSLLGGAFFHMLPAAATRGGDLAHAFLWAMLGFALFFALEQFLHWHHCHRASADCNVLGGLGVAGVFSIDVRLGITAWLAAAAHEVPQELGDFGVLMHGGWQRGSALLFNLLSGCMFLVGALAAYFSAKVIDVDFLVPFAAGNFIYIGASDLVPEVNKHRSVPESVVHFLAFAAGIAILWAIRSMLEP
jgi:zinc and cadmium transporter